MDKFGVGDWKKWVLGIVVAVIVFTLAGLILGDDDESSAPAEGETVQPETLRTPSSGDEVGGAESTGDR